MRLPLCLLLCASACADRPGLSIDGELQTVDSLEERTFGCCSGMRLTFLLGDERQLLLPMLDRQLEERGSSSCPLPDPTDPRSLDLAHFELGELVADNRDCSGRIEWGPIREIVIDGQARRARDVDVELSIELSGDGEAAKVEIDSVYQVFEASL